MKQGKLDMLLDLLEHPDNYSESQKDELLADEEVKEVYRQMVEIREALDFHKSKEEMKIPSISEEWEQFRSEARRVKREETTFDERNENQFNSDSAVCDKDLLSSRKIVSLWSPMRKVAAVAVILVFSGITFAAIHLVTRNNQTSDSSQIEQAIVEKDSLKTSTALVSNNQEEKVDTVATAKLPLLYENVELQNILAPIAEHFHVSVSYQSEASRHIRLYLQLMENMNLDDIIELMNHFEKVNIRHEGNILIVE